MKLSMKPCAYCGRSFRPNPRTAKHQKACHREECRRARQRQKLRRWRMLHPDLASKWLPKLRAWAKAYPDYWRQWRGDHRDYREREKLRMRAKRRQARRVANETAIGQIAVEKLQSIRAEQPITVANETVIARRMDALVDFLIWKESVAKRSAIEPRIGAYG